MSLIGRSGEIAAAGELLLEPVGAALAESVLGSAAVGLDVVPGQLGARAEVMGAVALALRLARPILP